MNDYHHCIVNLLFNQGYNSGSSSYYVDRLVHLQITEHETI